MNPSAASTALVDSALSDVQCRTTLYTGPLFVQPPRAPILAFVEFARGMIREPLSHWGPEKAQFEPSPDGAMAFHPPYRYRAPSNDSAAYSYCAWNRLHRGATVAQLIECDPRPLPKATEPLSLEPQLRPVCPVGGLIASSRACMRLSVPDTAGRLRFSIDFRTVQRDDARSRRGVPRCDEPCTMTTLRDCPRGTDHERLPANVESLHDDGPVADGQTLHQPAGA